MKVTRCCVLAATCLAVGSCAAPPGPGATRTPDWVNKVPDRMAEVLVERHLCKDGPAWGLARRDPEGKLYGDLAYEEYGSAAFCSLVKQHDLWDKVPPLTDQEREKALAFWQGWQDPETGLFKDPRDPDRMVGEKYAVNEGRTELIPDLEKGLEYILSHQDPATGLWGPPSARLDRRLGGALKVITRLDHSMGMNVPYARQLADSLIKYERSGDWYRVGESFCVPHNVVILVAYCLEVSDYRRADLLWVLESKAREYKGIIGGYLGWDDWPLTIPPHQGPRTEWDKYRYRPLVQKDGSVKVIDTKKERFPAR